MKTLTNFVPTVSQQRVLAILLAASSAKLASMIVSSDPKLVAAKQSLGRLGVLTFTSSEATLSDLGQRMAVDTGITDGSGQLTNLGNQLIASIPQLQQNDMGMPEAEPPIGGVPTQESFTLLRELMRG